MSVFISRSLLLNQGEPAGVSPNAPIIGWRNQVDFDSIDATYELESFPATNLANDSTALEWRSSSNAVQYLTISLSGPVDYVAFATHNLSSVGANISVEILNEDEEWVEIFEPVIMRDDYPAILRFEETQSTQLRVKIEAATLPPAVSVLFVGLTLRLPRNLYVGHTPINYGRQTQVASGRNEAGDFLGRIITRRRKTTEVSLGNLPPDWFRTEFEPFMNYAEEFAFFFAWRPRDYPFEVGFAWLLDDAQSNNQLVNGFMQASFSIGAIAGRGGVPMIAKGPKWSRVNGVWVRNHD